MRLASVTTRLCAASFYFLLPFHFSSALHRLSELGFVLPVFSGLVLLIILTSLTGRDARGGGGGNRGAAGRGIINGAASGVEKKFMAEEGRWGVDCGGEKRRRCLWWLIGSGSVIGRWNNFVLFRC